MHKNPHHLSEVTSSDKSNRLVWYWSNRKEGCPANNTFFFLGTTHLYLTDWSMKKVSGVFRFKHRTDFLITNELWQVCWVATCPILSVMPADSSALISECWNMWKKLVFYISQLVTSSSPRTLTSHPAPYTPMVGGEYRTPPPSSLHQGFSLQRFMFCIMPHRPKKERK